MNMKKVSPAACILAVLFLLIGSPAAGLFAQQEGSHKEAHKAHLMKLVGCLEEGDEEGYYVLVDEDGEEVDVTGLEELAKHLGHKVELTGSWETEYESKVFEATEIKHLSTDCE